MNWIALNRVFGSGSGTVIFTVAVNSGSGARTGTVMIANLKIQVTQANCTYSVTAGIQSFPADGGGGSVGVSTQAGCGWTVTSNAGWLTFGGANSRTGGGSVTEAVAKNTGAARSATLTVAGKAISVSQSASLPAACGATNISSVVSVTKGAFSSVPPLGNLVAEDITVANTSGGAIRGPVFLVMDGLPRYGLPYCPYGCGLVPGPTLTRCASPSGSYLVQFSAGDMAAGKSVTLRLNFAPWAGPWGQDFAYTTRVLSGAPSQ